MAFIPSDPLGGHLALNFSPCLQLVSSTQCLFFSFHRTVSCDSCPHPQESAWQAAGVCGACPQPGHPEGPAGSLPACVPGWKTVFGVKDGASSWLGHIVGLWVSPALQCGGHRSSLSYGVLQLVHGEPRSKILLSKASASGVSTTYLGVSCFSSQLGVLA